MFPSVRNGNHFCEEQQCPGGGGGVVCCRRLVLCHLNTRGLWNRRGELVVELTTEAKLSLAQQTTAGSGTSLKDLHFLARGCHGTWLPRVTVPDTTQS
jgi:hypothetical protein